MNDWKNKIIAEILAGTLLATFLAVPGAIVGMVDIQNGGNYGYGCSSIINSILGIFGYEACVSFGWVFGPILGAVVGVWLMSRLAIKNYRRVIMIFGLIFLLLFVLDVLNKIISNGEDSMMEISWSLLDYVDYAWYLVISSFQSILLMLLLPLGISLIITLLFNLVHYLLDYFHIQKQY